MADTKTRTYVTLMVKIEAAADNSSGDVIMEAVESAIHTELGHRWSITTEEGERVSLNHIQISKLGVEQDGGYEG